MEYWSLQIEKLLSSLETSKKGLGGKEAEKRLGEYGYNTIKKEETRSALKIFLSQFKNPLIYILVFATIIAAFVGDKTEAMIILAIVFLNSVLGFFQEYRSEKALEKLRKYIKFKAKVFRNGGRTEIEAEKLVPGDIVFLNIGDKVPADIRLIEVRDFSADESILTGESLQVYKKTEPFKKENPNPQDLINTAFMGTIVASGTANGVVVSTGESTFFGKTASSLKEEKKSDFEENMANFGNFLLKVILITTIFVFTVNFLLHKGLVDSLLFALALAVAITPEVLPIIITVALSRGALKLAKKKVVVKRLSAIESIGNMDILCMDKTGTLTENKIIMTDYFDLGGKKEDKIVLYSLLANSAVVNKDKITGNPLDVAIWKYAKGASIEKFEKIDEIEFDFERKRMSVVVKNEKILLISKGAPESIIDICKNLDKKKAMEKVKELSSSGHRVLAVGFKEVKSKKDYTKEDEKDLKFLGFLTFTDPPKKDAKDALKKFDRLGVEIKVLTGDDPFVALKVCRELGMEIKEEDVILGSDGNVNRAKIFARVTPEQKLEIVKALKKEHVVGFLGDGINDAPALRIADVGITVDTASDVARDASDIILLKKSLNVVANGIREGRRSFGNIMKYILNTISANFGNMFTIAISSLFLKFIPLLPTQILLANFMTDMPMLSISTDNVDSSILRRPKKWDINLISKFMMHFGALSSIFDFMTIFILMFVLNLGIPGFRTAWFLESCLSEIVITFAIRSKKKFYKSKPSKILVFMSAATFLIILFAIYSPLGKFFEFSKLSIPLLIMILMILLVYFSCAEVLKRYFFKKYEF